MTERGPELPQSADALGLMLPLSGLTVDLARVRSDVLAYDWLVALLAQLWDAPVDPLEPVPPFSPGWEELP